MTDSVISYETVQAMYDEMCRCISPDGGSVTLNGKTVSLKAAWESADEEGRLNMFIRFAHTLYDVRREALTKK